MGTHLAAILPAKGEPFQVQARQTPRPGPGELLVEVKSVALNPADRLMRDQGIFIPAYPTVIGFDIAGLVLEVGENVPVDSLEGSSAPFFRPGVTRIAAYAASAWRACDPDYGAFQEKCLVPWQHAVILPSEGLSWNQAATLPVAVQVPLSAWDAMGFPRCVDASASLSPSTLPTSIRSHEEPKEALLIWGASSSVGTMGVQSARLIRQDDNSTVAAVYATAGIVNQTYVQSLGADRVFDYKSPQVVEDIISAAKEDGLVIRHCFLAMGQMALCQDVLRAFTGDEQRKNKRKRAKIASAPIVPADAEKVEGVETIFVMPSMDEEERSAQFRYWMGTWLGPKLAKKSIKPSPEPQVVGRGLEALEVGLDMISRGVSCTKLVVEIAD